MSTDAAPVVEPETVGGLLETVRAPDQLSAWHATLQVMRFSLRRTFLGRRLIWNVLLVMLPLAISLLVVGAANRDRMQEEFLYLALSVLHLPIIVPVFALTFATAFPWPQADDGSLTFWFTSPAPRWTITAGRYVAALLTGWLLLPISVLAIGLPLEVPVGDMILRAIVVTEVVYPAYLALFMLISTVTRRAMPLAVAFLVVENVLAFLAGLVPRMTLVFYSRTLVWHGVPPHLRNFTEEVLGMEQTLRSGEVLSIGDATWWLFSVALLALAGAMFLVGVVEFRGKTVQPA